MAARHEVRLVDQVLEELLNNNGEEITKEMVEQQEGVMDKDEQARSGCSSARIGISDLMQLYNIWDIYESQRRVGNPGPMFWSEAAAGFPHYTASSLYTRFRALMPTFKKIDKLEYYLLELTVSQDLLLQVLQK